jgi:hypothetical protein
MISRFLVVLVVCICHLGLHPFPVSDEFLKLVHEDKDKWQHYYCEHIGPYDLMILSRSYYLICLCIIQRGRAETDSQIIIVQVDQSCHLSIEKGKLIYHYFSGEQMQGGTVTST